MAEAIHYVNTDLDLESEADLTELAAAFEARGLFALHVARHDDDGLWRATFETDESYDEPEPNIAAMLAVVESLPQPLRAVWSGCGRRVFDVGYECGDGPRGFGHPLGSELLGRAAAAGASLRITLYPPGH